MSQGEADQRRRAQNRLSAQRTRHRQRLYIEMLEKQYHHLYTVNELLHKQLKVVEKHHLGKRISRNDTRFEEIPIKPRLPDWEKYVEEALREGSSSVCGSKKKKTKSTTTKKATTKATKPKLGV